MGLAVSRNYKSRDGERREETLFINVTVWERTATYCGENLRKGRPILVEGRLKSDSWEDKTTGQKRTKIEIHGERVQTLDWEDRGGGAPPARQSQGSPQHEEPVAEDDIPF
jgi:single-strand DNA-binding protein